jgi:hypothetical protein
MVEYSTVHDSVMQYSAEQDRRMKRIVSVIIITLHLVRNRDEKTVKRYTRVR